MKYELDWQYLERSEKPWFSNYHLISIFTGYTPNDVYEAQKEVCRRENKRVREAWGGQMFVKVSQFLGFNTSGRFVKFDPNTDKPCIMRANIANPKFRSQWYAYVYHNGKVNNKWTIDEWQSKHINLIITSMLEIWI